MNNKVISGDEYSPFLMQSGFLNNKIKVKSQLANQYTFFLDEEIGRPSEYRDEIHTLANAGEYDSIDIIINSPGGVLASALAYCEAIKASPATVTSIIIGDCASAATIIALNSPQVVVMDSAEFMIHTAFFGSLGKANNVKDHVDFTYRQTNEIIDKTYTGFLTKKEIEQVKVGVEFWFNADQTRERLESRMKYLLAETKKKAKVQSIGE